MALLRPAKQRQSMERLSKAWHATEKHRAARRRNGEEQRGEEMARKSDDLICKGKVVHRLEHIRMKQMERSKVNVPKDAVNRDSRLLRSSSVERD
jgi:hypothetical protein